MGHEHASTTALYTCVSSDYRIRTLRRVLNATVSDALTFDDESSLNDKSTTPGSWPNLWPPPACTTAPS